MHIHSTPHYPNYPIAPYGHTQGSRLEKDRSFGERFGLWYRNTKKTGLLQCTWQNDRSFYQKDRSFPKTTGRRCICKTTGLPLLTTGLSVKTTGFSPPKDRSFLLVWCVNHQPEVIILRPSRWLALSVHKFTRKRVSWDQNHVFLFF